MPPGAAMAQPSALPVGVPVLPSLFFLYIPGCDSRICCFVPLVVRVWFLGRKVYTINSSHVLKASSLSVHRLP
ncbi:tripeptidyl peptidase I, isoform CRA_f [Rattus norvegicus]|uniref:Tripeptidyl peptidase I, isoform CRA_f n=1 Tax=Rattus norvegicus TaxID=10116 RepID=A6I7N5_RAT|nr:tripeptidyl peptidase I, isoform CRA_f [Rattus norvegicus]